MPRNKFPPKAAGSKIITTFPRVQIGEKIRDVEKMLLDNANEFDTIDYAYVLDDNSACMHSLEMHAGEELLRAHLFPYDSDN